MYIDYSIVYERMGKELTFKEWISTVKQLGMMHILYWRLKEFELYLASLGAKRLHPFPVKTLYNGLKRERETSS